MRRITVSLPWPLSVQATQEVLSFAFSVMLVTYVGLYFAENFWPGLVSRYQNADTFFWAAVITGALSSLWPAVVPRKRLSGLGWREFLWIAVLGLGSAGLSYLKTQTLGWMAVAIAVLVGVIVAGLSILIYTSDGASGTDDST